MLIILFIPMIVSGLLTGYVTTMVLPIGVFTIVHHIGTKKRNRHLINSNIIFHLLAIINWVIMYFASKSIGSEELAGLNLITPYSVLGIIDIIVIIVLLATGDKKKDVEPVKSVEVDNTPTTYIKCPHCGFDNPDNNVYCFKCNKNLK